MSNITESINTFDIVNKTLGLAKTGLGKLVFPLKSKYISEYSYFIPQRIYHGQSKYTTDILISMRFNVIFKGVYDELKINKKERDGDIPKNDIYYRKIDNLNIVIMTISNISDIDIKEANAKNLKIAKVIFIGPDCEKWNMHFRSQASKESTLILKNIRNDFNINYKSPYVQSRADFSKEIVYQVSPKTFDDIVMKRKDELINYLDRFIKNEDVYDRNNIPYKLGCLFSGDPGTGKSSLAYTIAHHVGYQVCTVCQECILKIETGETRHDINNFSGFVILLDEIDSFLSNDSDEKGKNHGILRKEQLFSFIDKLPNECILVATTNYIDRLDDALIRSGRFDIKMEMPYFDHDDAKEMISKFEVDPSFINRYPDNEPIRPSDLQFDLVQEISKNILS